MRTSTTIAAALLMSVAAPTAARADQCAWLADRAVAERAVRVAVDHSVIAYCEPCGDAAPSAPFVPRAVAARPVADGMSEVTLDGRGVDLAYTFVRTSETAYRNLADLAGCPASGVSSSLRIDPATATGVVIGADASAPRVAAAPPASPCAAAFVGEVDDDDAPGFALALLFGLAVTIALPTSALLALAGWLLLAHRRRARRSALPRALSLIDRHPPR